MPFFILPGISVTVLTILETRLLTVSRILPNIFETLVLKPLNLVFAVLTRLEIGLIVTFLIPFQTFPENVLIALKMFVILFFIFVNLFLTKFTMDVMIFLKNAKTAFHLLEITLQIAVVLLVLVFFIELYRFVTKSTIHLTTAENTFRIPLHIHLNALIINFPSDKIPLSILPQSINCT